MISRLIVAVFAVMASVGLMIYGIGSSFYDSVYDWKRIGVILMVVGAVGTGVGIAMYRANERSIVDEILAQERSQPR